MFGHRVQVLLRVNRCVVDDTVYVGVKLVTINSDGEALAGWLAKPVAKVVTVKPESVSSIETAKTSKQTLKAVSVAKAKSVTVSG